MAWRQLVAKSIIWTNGIQFTDPYMRHSASIKSLILKVKVGGHRGIYISVPQIISIMSADMHDCVTRGGGGGGGGGVSCSYKAMCSLVNLYWDTLLQYLLLVELMDACPFCDLKFFSRLMGGCNWRAGISLLTLKPSREDRRHAKSIKINGCAL